MPRSLAELTSREAVQAALDEFMRLGQAAFLSRYGFGRASQYLVKDPQTGQWADSKAIAGAAFGMQYPADGPLAPSQFSGGMATVVRRLEMLGFEVQPAAEIAGSDWRSHEVYLIVADYMAMLQSELAGQPYNKSQHRRSLMANLPGRTAGAIEFKHCNISAVMIELGFPYLEGYQPRTNFQRSMLVEAVSRQVMRHSVLDDLARVAVERPAVPASSPDFSKVVQRPPVPNTRAAVAEEPRAAYQGSAIQRDYLAREERNRSLGLAGEVFALDFERWRLSQLGAAQLAERVRHVAAELGDGLGYDIHSFEPDGRDRFIEVKTTAFGDRTPFFVSSNEVQFARSHASTYRLYRLFSFRKDPRLFELSGPIEQHCRLDATTYRASFA